MICNRNLQSRCQNSPCLEHAAWVPWIALALVISLTGCQHAANVIPEETVRFERWVQQSEQYSKASDKPVYSTDPEVVPTMIGTGSDYGSDFYTSRMDRSDAWFRPDVLAQMDEYFWPRATMSDGLAFLHRRISTNGHDRLVVVKLYSIDKTHITSTDGMPLVGVYFLAEAYKLTGDHHLVLCSSTGSWNTHPRIGQFTLFGGVADPADTSRFTIHYSARGESGTIEGRLMDNDTVDLTVAVGHLGLFNLDKMEGRNRDKEETGTTAHFVEEETGTTAHFC